MPAAPGYEGGPPPVSNGEMMRAVYATDPANPDAVAEDVLIKGATQSGTNADGTYKPGTMDVGVTPKVQVTPSLPRGGANAKLDPSKYTPGHEPDGHQDGSGRIWRKSVGQRVV